jgi:hypothetical protein
VKPVELYILIVLIAVIRIRVFPVMAGGVWTSQEHKLSARIAIKLSSIATNAQQLIVVCIVRRHMACFRPHGANIVKSLWLGGVLNASIQLLHAQNAMPHHF